MIYLELFWSFFQIGILSFGGGYAALPLIQNQIVDIHGWLSMAEFSDIVVISQMTPGPIAINAATFVGTKVGGTGILEGILGSVAATLGCITPSCIIVLILAMLYKKYSSLAIVQGALRGLRPAVVALIGSAGLSMIVLAVWGEAGFLPTLAAIDWIGVVLLVAALVILRKWKPNPILMMVICGVLGGAAYLITGNV